MTCEFTPVLHSILVISAQQKVYNKGQCVGEPSLRLKIFLLQTGIELRPLALQAST